MENRPGNVTPGAFAKADEGSVTATCRNARMEINELAMTRKNLCDRIRALREILKKTEDDYWSQYHLRLNGTNTSTATKVWVANFATKEGVVAKQTKQKLDEFRGQLQVLEVQRQKADDEFWGKWQDVITKLATIPKPSQTAPEAFQPSAAIDAPGSKHKEDLAPLPQPRLTIGPPTHTPVAASPLAPPAFFPDGPPLATPTTIEADLRNSDTKFVVPEPSQQVSGTTLETTAPIPGCPQIDDSIVPTDAQHETSVDAPAFLGVPSQAIPQVDDRIASTEDDSVTLTEAYHETTAEDTTFLGVTQPEVGQIYKAYYKHEDQEGWWACTVLPTLPTHESEAWADQVGISFPSASLDLWHDAPECYVTTIETKRKNGKSTKKHHVITGWKPGYEDGGPLVTQRAFPVLFFEDRKGVQGHFNVPMPPRKFNFKPQSWDWVEAKNLRLLETWVGPVYGGISANNFKTRKAALGPCRPFDPSFEQYPTLLTDADPEDSEYRPAKRLRIRLVSRNCPSTKTQSFSTDEGRQETEMTDAGSLSGDTIAASSSAVQSDDELSKPH